MRLIAFLCAIVLGAMPALAAPVPAKVASGVFMYQGAKGLSPSYLNGKWDAVDGKRTCKGPYYYAEYTLALDIMRDGELIPYQIRGNRMYYENVDGERVYDVMTPVDANTIMLRILNDHKLYTLKRCR